MKTPFDLYNAFRISVIEDSVDNAISHFDGFMKNFRLEKEQLSEVDFTKICSENTLPYNSEEIRFFLYEPLSNPGCTVFFPNFGGDGWYTAVYNYVHENKKNAYQVGFHLNDLYSYPGYFFYYFFYKNGDVKERVVQAIKEESGWDFCEVGRVLKIEDASNYSKRRITDRINNEIILDYMLNAKYNLKGEGFYKSANKIFLYKSKPRK